MKLDFKKILPHLISVIVIVLINVIYFMPQFQGKVLDMGDINSHIGMSKEAVDYRTSSGEEVLWTNSMFGGMPTYNISTRHQNNVTVYAQKALSLFLPTPAGVFILGMLSFYLCMVLMGISPWVSLIMAITFGFSTSNLMLLGAGHVTKVKAIMAAAPIVAGTMLVMKGRYWLGGLIFALFLGMNVMANHPQMTYYLGLSLAIYMIFALVDAVQKGTLAQYAKSVAVLVLCSVIAVGTSATKLIPTYEYGKETMRGKPILSAAAGADPTSSSQVDGLAWDYAMGWSGGSLDLISTFIPYAAGGGTVEQFGKDTKFAKLTNQRNGARAYSYFGALPSTAGPYYFGAIVFFLFILGAIVVKGRFKWWLVTGTVFTMLLALGKNFEILNKTLFDYAPMFSKFRTPNSALSITGVLLVVLAGMGLNEVLKREDKSSLKRPLAIAVGAVSGFCVLFGMIGPSMISFDTAYDGNLGAQQAVLDALLDDRASMMSSSAYRTAGFVLAAGTLLYGYLTGKVNQYIVLALIGLLAISDQLMINKNYFGGNFVSKRQQSERFNPRPVDQRILADSDPHFRVQDFSVDTYNSSSTSYFHKTIGGYHAAKLQRIADIIDKHLSKRSNEQPFGNQAVLDMLNTKYFIVPTGENSSDVRQNPSAAGNAWFVEEVKVVPDADTEIAALTGFDPQLTAIVHQEFSDYVSDIRPSKNGSIALTSYSPNELIYTSNTTSEQLAVFSEVWYGPNLGWNAYIDDQPVDHIRADYLLRALKVPAGQHTIRFSFEPAAYSTGKMVSLISSVLMLLIGAFAVYNLYRGRQEVEA